MTGDFCDVTFLRHRQISVNIWFVNDDNPTGNNKIAITKLLNLAKTCSSLASLLTFDHINSIVQCVHDLTVVHHSNKISPLNQKAQLNRECDQYEKPPVPLAGKSETLLNREHTVIQ